MGHTLRTIITLFTLSFALSGLAAPKHKRADSTAAVKTEGVNSERIDAVVSGNWIEVEIGIVGPASEDILNDALRAVESRRLAGLVVVLDTPGGALDSTRNMVKAIMASPVPVIVWVGPAGSRAGSAGSFITLAAHVAAMAPGTNIGAAHPVDVNGAADDESEGGRKVTNDTSAFIESIAVQRGRNKEVARAFVEDSLSITDAEALKMEVIDLSAADLPTLLRRVDGRTVKLDSGQRVKIDTRNATTVPYQKSFRQKLLELLSNPNLFYLLFLAGLIGLAYELTHPGVFLPGVVGGICLILAFIATSVVPISWGAAALLLVGIGMLVAEAFVPSFGALGIGGLVAFVIGSIFLVDPGGGMGPTIAWQTIAPVAVVAGGAFLLLGFLVARSERAQPVTGHEAMRGKIGNAMQDFGPEGGQIRFQGSIWNARLPSGVSASVRRGDKVRVEAVDGLELTVTKV